jgi:hypothetical protein
MGEITVNGRPLLPEDDGPSGEALRLQAEATSLHHAMAGFVGSLTVLADHEQRDSGAHVREAAAEEAEESGRPLLGQPFVHHYPRRDFYIDPDRPGFGGTFFRREVRGNSPHRLLQGIYAGIERRRVPVGRPVTAVAVEPFSLSQDPDLQAYYDWQLKGGPAFHHPLGLTREDETDKRIWLPLSAMVHPAVALDTGYLHRSAQTAEAFREYFRRRTEAQQRSAE